MALSQYSVRALPDVIIAPDAVMLLGTNSGYRKVLDLLTYPQYLYVKNGKSKGRTPTLFVYPNSSASHQLIAHIEKHIPYTMNLPSKFVEDEIEIWDYVTLPRKMKPGDMVFAWEPLSQRFDLDPKIERVETPAFETTVSLYCHENFHGSSESDYPVLVANALVAAWNYCKQDSRRVAAWLALLEHPGFIEGMIRGIADEA